MVCLGQSVKQVSKNLKINYETLKQWMEKHKLQNLELLLLSSQNHSHGIEELKILEDPDLVKDLDFICENNAGINSYSNDNLESLLSVAKSIQFTMDDISDQQETTVTNKTTNTDTLFTCL